MVDPNNIYDKIINLLDSSRVEYKLFSHKEALSWEEIEQVRKETGFFGTELKCLVLKVGENLVIYITLFGNKVNFDLIKERLKVNKVRLSTPEELMENFGAKPGCAYPFGFDSKFDIYVDPKIFEQEWVLFSPAIPTKTIQLTGPGLRFVFGNVQNHVQFVTDFNQI